MTTDIQDKIVDDNIEDLKGDGSLTTLWEYEHTNGKWVRYNDEMTEKLNQAMCDSIDIELNEEDVSIRIDIISMKQLNLETGFKRNLRCVVRKDDNSSFFVWEIKKGRRYEPLPRDLQLCLELDLGKKNTSTIIYNSENWEVDFNKMQFTSNENTMKIRRTMSMAESSFSAAPALPSRRTRTTVKRSLDIAAMIKIDQNNEEEEEKEEEKPKKTRKIKSGAVATTSTEVVVEKKQTIILKGRVPVDSECISKLYTAHVFHEGDIIWDAMLNQTNVDNNNNKYYLMQILEDDAQKDYSVWFRWGRVGYKGQSSLISCGSDLEKAKQEFSKKFSDKTKNEWYDREDFEPYPGKYTLIHTGYSIPKEVEEEIKEIEEDKTPPPESTLDKRIQQLLLLICNINAMEETVTQLEFDSTRSPLGKLTASQIAEGYRLLGELEKHIKEKKFGQDFVQTVNEYYTKIPHHFGMRQPPLIKSVEALKRETELLEVLEDIEIAVKSMGEAKKNTEKIATVDKHYNKMECDVVPIEVGTDDYNLVDKYMKFTHGDTHMFEMKITQIYKIDRHMETERFKKDIGNRMLLWHGSRTTNFYGILSQGLRIAPPEAPACGYMFGKGIYFADMASKSGNYCFPAPGKPGLLLLCEVALGKCNELQQADYNASDLPKGKSSTKGVGMTYPNPVEYVNMEDGIIVPCGKPMKTKKTGSLLYNEYIVYDVAQVRIRYLVEVEFNM